jgi:hypothetical protein
MDLFSILGLSTVNVLLGQARAHPAIRPHCRISRAPREERCVDLLLAREQVRNPVRMPSRRSGVSTIFKV